ncbi:MAG: prolipoprotein diacylglyceryl transferase [Anaerolineales bacterium]|nr:prolipoprotein diacylglyceryl transferase [Anaerolineales bacterium]
MRPILFYMGPVPIFAYGIFILLGTIALFAVALYLGRQDKLSFDQLLPIAFGVGAGGVVGAKLTHVLVEPDKATEFLNFFGLFLPGTPGNIIGLMIGGYVGGFLVRTSVGLPANGKYYAPAIAIASAIWRIGCTLAGCCHGKETDFPIAIFLENAQRHPTMIYEGLFNLFMVFVLWRIYPRFSRHDDSLLFFYFVCYAFFRFWLEFIRVYPPVLWGLTGIQYLCLGILFILGIWWSKQSDLNRWWRR